MSEILFVGLLALGTAVATSLGVLPLVWLGKNRGQRFLGTGNAIAAGLMLAASVGLIFEGFAFGDWQTIIGILLGLLFITWGHSALHKYEDRISVGQLARADAKKAFIIIAILTIHSFAEGVGIGVSFGGGQAFGLFVTIALAIHNIPEGLAVGLSLMPKGVSAWRAAWYAFLTSIPQPLVAIPAFIFVTFFTPILPYGLGFAAGAMIWLIIAELIPEANETTNTETTAIMVTASFAAMMGLQVLLAAVL